MAKKTDPSEGDPQFAYRVPGEPETAMGMESRENPDADEADVKKAIKAEQDKADKVRDATDSGEVSEFRGMSAPMTQKQVDDENTSSRIR